MKNYLKILGILKKPFKVLLVYSIVFSLIQTSFISAAFATGTNSSTGGGFGAQDIIGLANGALGAYAQYLGQKQQMLQQQITAANNQRLMAQLGPTCRKADGTACYATPAKMFPECTLPASMASMPVNVCSNATPEVNQISSMITYESISQGWMNYYDQMMNEASNSKYSVGLSCLNDKQKAIDSQLTEMVNSLQRLQDRLNQDKQIFRDNNKKLLSSMDTLNDELFGSTKNNLGNKTKDFAQYFSNSCQSVIGKDNLKGGIANGLNGIVQNLSTTNKSAADFNQNKNVIEADVRRETDKIAATIKSNGVEDFLNKGYIPQSDESAKTFGSIGVQIQKQKSEFMTAKARIDKDLADVGYTAPALDSKFSIDSEDFLAGANDFFKKKYVNDCVTGADSGIAIPVDDILKSLEQKSTNNAGTARNGYRDALKKILDSDSMIDDKMSDIKDLQNKFPDITITYKDSSQARVTENPYNLFMKTIDKCQQRFAQDDTFSSKGSKGVSYQKKVERAKASLQELKTLNDSYASKVTQSILSQVLDCGGSPLKSGTCSEDTLNTSKDNFCISQASVCANQIQGCYAEAAQQVQIRKTKMENLAKTVNANVSAMVARSNSLFEGQKAAVTNITKLIQSKFPGTNFEIPKDMFVSMPELTKDTYGVDMAGDGKMKFLDDSTSMPAKLDKLMTMFRDQKKLVDESIKGYIDQQKTAMQTQHDRWEKLNEQCTTQVDASSKALKEMNDKGMKDQAEQDQKVAKFCRKYNSISQNPVGGCGKAQDLASTADEVSARLSNKSLSLTEQYDSACDGFNNQSDDSSTKDRSRSKNKKSSKDDDSESSDLSAQLVISCQKTPLTPKQQSNCDKNDQLIAAKLENELAKQKEDTANGSSTSSAKTQISHIGEQMTGPCDMQSNSSVAKNTGFDLKSFDSQVLGSASGR